ncbi:MAG: L-histidine N(alpha)-methyltransferase, partial [Alphaproteobacteria bacterium]|nr:L-histidine N(alpha)-methyltransferase [Alphaproteobacteria bacterium]
MSIAGLVAPEFRSRPQSESSFARDLCEGLSAKPKRAPCKYFYDREGSELFTRITALPEYYPTRTELGLLTQHAGEIASLIGAHAAVIEFGAGSLEKATLLLGALKNIAAYVPVDIS